jgi:hypothetical protein
MNYRIILIFLTCFSISAQQLANMDFETWSYDPLAKGYTLIGSPWLQNNSCVKGTNNDTICTIFATRQTGAYSGQYCLKIQTPTGLEGGLGSLSTWNDISGDEKITFTAAPLYLTGYYKLTLGAKFDYSQIVVDFFDKDGNTIKYGTLDITKAAKDWTKFSVTLFDIPPVTAIASVDIFLNHALNSNSVTASNATVLYLDNLQFIYTVNALMDEAIKAGFSYQDGIIDITQMHNVENMTIFNLNGQKCSEIKTTYNTNTLTPGIYLLEYLQNGAAKKLKLAVTQ